MFGRRRSPDAKQQASGDARRRRLVREPESVVPGRHRSISIARRSGSCASSRTAPSPFQRASASASCSDSSSGKLILRTASPAGITSDTLPPVSGVPRSSPHCSAHSSARCGSRSSQSAPPGTSRRPRESGGQLDRPHARSLEECGRARRSADRARRPRRAGLLRRPPTRRRARAAVSVVDGARDRRPVPARDALAGARRWRPLSSASAR